MIASHRSAVADLNTRAREVRLQPLLTADRPLQVGATRLNYPRLGLREHNGNALGLSAWS